MQDPSDLPARADFGRQGPAEAPSFGAATDPAANSAADSVKSFLESESNQNWHEEVLGERTDGEYKTTFHVFKNDQQICYYLERIYNRDGKMVRMVKRAQDGRSETRFDPDSGDIERIFEAYTLPDGNNLSKEKRYLTDENTTESVLVVDPRGILVRAVLREAVGLITVYQGQTEFAKEGYSTISVNHWFNRENSRMVKREQIQWLPSGERGVTEHFHFDVDGCLIYYHKLLYHPGTDRYLEEIHNYEEQTQKLRRKEVKSFERNAIMANMEVTTFGPDGRVVEQSKSFVSRVAGKNHL